MGEIIHLNWKTFSDKYEPIQNAFEKEAACDGHLFTEQSQLRDVPNARVWTLIDNNNGEDMYITNGYKIINAMGYLVSKVEWNPSEVIEIRLAEGDYIENNGEDKDKF